VRAKKLIDMAENDEVCIDAEEYAAFAEAMRELATRYISVDDIREKRGCWISSIDLLVQLLKRLPDPNPPAQRMLWDLIAALVDLNAGRSVALLKPEPPSEELREKKRTRKQLNQSRDGFIYHLNLGYLCAFVDLYVQRAGLSEVEAARRAVRAAQKTGVKLPKVKHSQRSDSDRLLDWRARFRSSRDKTEAAITARIADGLVRARFDQIKSDRPDGDDERIVDAMIKNEWIPSMGKKVR
jgi:hypothetical protein